MDTIKTIPEIMELLKAGNTIRYYFLSGVTAIILDSNTVVCVSIAHFLKLREDKVIDCESGVKKRDHVFFHGQYQEYSLAKLNTKD